VPSGPSYDELDEGRWSVQLPEDEEEAESARGNGWYNRAMHVREENGPSWGRVFLSVAAAVGTGALFGYIVLSLFTGEPLFPGAPNGVNSPPIQASSEPNLAPTVKEPSTTGVSGSTESTNPVNGEVSGENASASVQIDGDIYYMLQYGVFQNEDSMETAVGQLRDKGYASASEIKDGYRVYVGMARSRDEAELLATQMRDTEIYIKPLGGEPITVSSDKLSAGGAEFMNASGSLMRKLAQYSGNGLLEKQPQALEAADQAALQEAQRLWQGAQASIDKMGGSAAEDARAMVLALDSALGSMTEFNQEPSRFHLWNVQSAVMKALISDQELRTAIQPSVVG
jgi:cell division septation protein DedD